MVNQQWNFKQLQYNKFLFKNSNSSTFSGRSVFLFTISYISCSSSMTKSRSLLVVLPFLSTRRYCLFTKLSCKSLCLHLWCWSISTQHKNSLPHHKMQFQWVQFCVHVAGMHVHRLAQVWNAIITTKYYYDVYYPAVVPFKCLYCTIDNFIYKCGDSVH